MSLATLKAAAVCHWLMEEDTTANRVDDVGSSDLVPSGSIAAATGKFGNGADFEAGDSRSMSVADNTEVSLGDINCFVRFWMKPETVLGNPLTKDSGGSTTRDYGFYYSAGLRFYVFDPSGTFREVVISGVLSTGTWYEVWGWHDADNDVINGAVNGVLGTPVAHTTGIRDSIQAFHVGSRGGTAAFFDGIIDDVVIGKGVVPTSQDVTDSYASGTGVAFADWDAGGGGTVLLPFMMQMSH